VPAQEFNLKAYAAITWHNDPASAGLESRLADHRSQAARTATLPIAPPGQAVKALTASINFTGVVFSRGVAVGHGARFAAVEVILLVLEWVLWKAHVGLPMLVRRQTEKQTDRQLLSFFSFFPCGTGSISCPVLRPPNGPNARPQDHIWYTLENGNSENSLELNAN